MKRFMLVLAAAVIFMAAPEAVFSRGSSQQGGSEGKIVFKLSHVFLPQQPTHLGLAQAADRIKERTGGRIEIQIFPDGEIVTGLDGVEQCIRGAYFINVYDPSCMADWVPDYSALVGPMLYTSGEEYSFVCQSDFAKSLNAKAEAKGIKVLALDYNFGMRHMITAKKQITSIADIQGIKIRVPKSQLWIDTFTYLGASPVGLAWAEVYNSVQTGVVDALETSISDVMDNNIQEVAKYVTKTAHFVGTGAVMMSKAVWDKLSPQDQRIVEEEFVAGAKYNNELVNQEEARAQATLESKGMVFNEIDLTEFRNRAKTWYEKTPGLTPGLYNIISAEVAKYRK